MPRHRKERVSRHGAGQRIEESSRHASLSATRGRVSGPRHSAEPGRTAETGRTGEPGRTGDRGGRPDGRGPGQQQGIARGAARGVLVTPWFAAGTGFVIAAGLWIYAPHGLQIFSAEPKQERCSSSPCGSDGDGGGGSSTFGRGSPAKIPAGRHRAGEAAVASAGTGNPALAGLTFKYTVERQAHDQFGELITIWGKHPIEHWRLSFVIPGTKIWFVTGGNWSQTAKDGGTVSAYSSQEGKHRSPDGAGPGGGFNQDGFGQPAGTDPYPAGDPRSGQYGINIWVEGYGSPGRPADCKYDGQSFTFRY